LETKYGLSVNGLVHPAKIKRNNTIKPGDRLILTKPLGSGILSTGIKMDKIKPATMDRCIHFMRTLNKTASEVMQKYGVSACTDVTGFGLIGHLSEMLQGDITRFPSNPPSTKLEEVEKGKLPDKDILLFLNSIPIQDEVMDLIQQKYIPGGTYNNFDFFSPLMQPKEGISEDELYTLVDPQTSGGLIISVDADKAEALLEELHHRGVEDAAIIGQVEQGSGVIHIC
jgi:selenide, water dikinase